MTLSRLALSAAVVLAGCRAHRGAPPAGAQAELRDAAGVRLGTARFYPEGSGVEVEVEAQGLPPGSHGLRIHEHGRCEPPDFRSAGAPVGELPSLAAGPDGTAMARLLLPGATLAAGEDSLLRPGGAALVLGSGAPLACGVIEEKLTRLRRLLRKVRPVRRKPGAGR